MNTKVAKALRKLVGDEEAEELIQLVDSTNRQIREAGLITRGQKQRKGNPALEQAWREAERSPWAEDRAQARARKLRLSTDTEKRLLAAFERQATETRERLAARRRDAPLTKRDLVAHATLMSETDPKARAAAEHQLLHGEGMAETAARVLARMK